MSDKKVNKVLPVLFVNLFVFLTAAFFLPLEIYLGNYSEFTFAFENVWRIMLAFSLLSALILSVVESLLPEIVRSCILRLSIAAGICIYVQSMFMNGHLQELTGENVLFPQKTVLLNALVWLVIFGTVFVLLIFADKIVGREKENELIMLLSVAMIIIQLSGFISSSVRVQQEKASKNLYLSTEGEFNLYSGKNVVYFILDTCDKEYVDAALKEDPALFDAFTGFVSYTNAVAAYSRTYPALPYLLTHEKCYFDIPYREYIRNAFEKSDYLDLIKAAGADIRLYTSLDYIAEN